LEKIIMQWRPGKVGLLCHITIGYDRDEPLSSAEQSQPKQLETEQYTDAKANDLVDSHKPL
jgi:hypothetical protein